MYCNCNFFLFSLPKQVWIHLSIPFRAFQQAYKTIWTQRGLKQCSLRTTGSVKLALRYFSHLDFYCVATSIIFEKTEMKITLIFLFALLGQNLVFAVTPDCPDGQAWSAHSQSCVELPIVSEPPDLSANIQSPCPLGTPNYCGTQIGCKRCCDKSDCSANQNCM